MNTEPKTSELVLRLDAMTYGGDALGRVEGKAIFVRGGIAGEVVRAEIVEDRGRFARARVIEVVEPSPDRVQPRCPHFGFEETSCGGCAWQHMAYAAQLRYKTEIVREQFRRLGRISEAPVRDILPSPDVWAYRNHAQFSVTPDGRLGFQAAGSNTVVPVDVCHIVQPPIMEWLKSAGRAHAQAGVKRVDVRFPEPHSTIPTYRVKAAPFHVSAGSFFQVNTSLIETLVDLVLAHLDLKGGETVLDGYCGVGLFARFVAPVAGQVIGIESSPSAVADARKNLASFGHVELREGRVESVLATLAEPVDAAVFDPPRAGCGPEVIREIVACNIKRLVYVSCDPSTLARDARQLLDVGYALTDVQPLDMFPHTLHIETISTWVRAG
jgi:23S rRNA (uracil1939-C5)-methyltransferase